MSGAVSFRVLEGEVARVEPHEDGKVGQGLLDISPLRGGIEDDLLAVFPLTVPPGVGRAHAQGERQGMRHRVRLR